METTECFQLTAECGSKDELCCCAHFYFLALAAAVHLLSLSLSLFAVLSNIHCVLLELLWGHRICERW